MSRTFSTKCGSLERLKVCGPVRPQAEGDHQMRQGRRVQQPRLISCIERSDPVGGVLEGREVSAGSLTCATFSSSMVRGRPAPGFVRQAARCGP